MTDDLDRLLGPPAGEPDHRLHAAVRGQTARVIARRRWRRTGGKLALSAGLFAAGAGVGWAGKPVPPSPAALPPEVIVVPVGVPVGRPQPTPPDPYLTADRLELDAEKATDRGVAARLYRQAGDKYLTDAAEPGHAARCYRLSLQHAGPAGLAADPADSWLLSSLKTQLRSEVRDAGGHGL